MKSALDFPRVEEGQLANVDQTTQYPTSNRDTCLACGRERVWAPESRAKLAIG
jgi:hypothetical protein